MMERGFGDKKGARRARKRAQFGVPIRLLAALLIVSLGLAFSGWVVALDADVHEGFWGRAMEAAYLSLSVVAPSDTYTGRELLGAGVEQGSGAWYRLYLARYLGAVFFIATVATVAFLSAYQFFLRWKARLRFKGHIVVVGDTPLALETAKSAAWIGYDVAQFEPGGEETVPDGILTLDSDIGLDEMLLWSAAHRAEAIIVATGDNAENCHLAERIFEDKDFEKKARKARGFSPLASRTPESEQPAMKAGPHIFVCTDDQWFQRRSDLNYAFLEDTAQKVDGNQLDSVVEFVGENRAAARAVMTAEPVFRLQTAEIQHIMILGFGAMGQALLAEFIETQRVDPYRKQWVTILDPEPSAWSRFVQRTPLWDSVFDGVFLPVEIDNLGAHKQVFVDRLRATPPAAIYVATGSGMDAMAAAADAKRVITYLAENGALPEGRIGCPVFACARGGSTHIDGQIRERIAAGDTVAERLPIEPFGSWPDVIAAARVLDAEPDLSAFSIHATHNALYSDTPPTNWSNLTELQRHSSRGAANLAPALLHAAGFDLGPWLTAPGTPSVNALPRLAPGHPLINSPSTLLKLARLEHARFCAERVLQGFRLGEKSLARKRHPELVPFDDLPPGSQAYNIRYIAMLESILFERATGPFVARPAGARRPVMRPTDTALVRAAGLDPDDYTGRARPTVQDTESATTEKEFADG